MMTAYQPRRSFPFCSALTVALLVGACGCSSDTTGDGPAASSSDADRPAFAEAGRALVKLLGPLAPHMAEELHRELGGSDTVFLSGWPEHDPTAEVRDEVVIPVQVNGKVRGRLTVPVGIDEDDAVARAKKEAGVSRYLEGKTIRKVIDVPGRLLNLVVS